MRLLNSCSWGIRDFLSDDDIPPYSILSHTWGDEEINFRDWKSISSKELENMAGHKKFMHSCLQAAEEGIEWV
jgi:hypothetical protein